MRGNNHDFDDVERLSDDPPGGAVSGDTAQAMLERSLIEEGIADLEAGRVWTSDQIRKKIGLPQMKG